MYLCSSAHMDESAAPGTGVGFGEDAISVKSSVRNLAILRGNIGVNGGCCPWISFLARTSGNFTVQIPTLVDLHLTLRLRISGRRICGLVPDPI
jgi:hypothetical protein